MTQNSDHITFHQYALPAGTRLEHYVIEKLLGQNDFGLVYLARDESLACQVAIKEYLPEQLASRTQGNTVSPNTENTQAIFIQYRNNFIREAQQITQLDHPAIVRVMQVFEANNTAYMVMPYYTGEPLKCFQKRTNKHWNEAELNALLEPLLNALELLHQKNILHCDIAPDNIFLKNNGQPILIDVGLARQIESEYTLSQNLLYKHGYSPIERYSLSGKTQVGAWTDIYSLAAVVYELATGKKVLPAPNRVNDDQMPSLKDCRPVGLSANFIASIDFALAIKVKDRPCSISEWRDYMKKGKLSSSTTETVPAHLNIKNVQRPLIILASALLIIGVAYGTFMGYQTWQQPIFPAIQQPEKAEDTQKTTKIADEADKKYHDAEQEQARLAEKTAQQSKAKEEDRLNALDTDAVPITEICAVPEMYLDKTINIQGQSFDHVFFSEPVTWFRLYNDNCLVHCVFKTSELNPDVRRLLLTIDKPEPLQITGHLVKDNEGLLNGKTHSGYQFIVSDVIKTHKVQ